MSNSSDQVNPLPHGFYFASNDDQAESSVAGDGFLIEIRVQEDGVSVEDGHLLR